jgi:RimJ/RimL family protein N-acetyltransferase
LWLGGARKFYEMEIVEANNAELISQFTALMVEYAKSMGENLQNSSLRFDFADGMARYSPPRGRMLLAFVDDEAVGSVALTRLDAESCEFKRLYVKPMMRGEGIGDALSRSALQHARWLGFSKVKLSTYKTNIASIKLYRKLGFVDDEPFKETEIKDELLFLALDISTQRMGNG